MKDCWTSTPTEVVELLSFIDIFRIGRVALAEDRSVMVEEKYIIMDMVIECHIFSGFLLSESSRGEGQRFGICKLHHKQF